MARSFAAAASPLHLCCSWTPPLVHAWPGFFSTCSALFLIGLPLGLRAVGMRPAIPWPCVSSGRVYRPAALPAPLGAVIGLLASDF